MVSRASAVPAVATEKRLGWQPPIPSAARPLPASAEPGQSQLGGLVMEGAQDEVRHPVQQPLVCSRQLPAGGWLAVPLRRLEPLPPKHTIHSPRSARLCPSLPCRPRRLGRRWISWMWRPHLLPASGPAGRRRRAPAWRGSTFRATASCSTMSPICAACRWVDNPAMGRGRACMGTSLQPHTAAGAARVPACPPLPVCR